MSRAVLAVVLSGCFVTSTQSGVVGEGPEIEQHQWFTGWGAVRLSDEAGSECRGGLARSESGLGIADLIIDGAFAVATGVVGSVVCPLPAMPTTSDATTYATCTAFFSALGPALLSRKSVAYRCAN